MREVRFIFVRHAKPKLASQLLYGHYDLDIIPFTLENLPSFLRTQVQWDSTLCVSSPLKRAYKTAQLTQKLNGINQEIILDNNLAEQNFGDWDGCEKEKIFELRGRPYWNFYAHTVPPNGESFIDVLQRGEKVINYYLNNNSNSNIVFFTHGGFIRAVLAHLLSIPHENIPLFDLAPLSCTIIEYRDQMWWIKGVGLK